MIVAVVVKVTDSIDTRSKKLLHPCMPKQASKCLRIGDDGTSRKKRFLSEDRKKKRNGECERTWTETSLNLGHTL